MGETREQKAAAIFAEAMEVPAAERAVFLDLRCGEDAELRAEVESLLTHLDQATSFLESSPVELSASQMPTMHTGMPGFGEAGKFEPGMRVGKYVIQKVLGEGGMGVVYLAEQESPRRKVALKVIRPGYFSQGLLRRFEYEAQVLGRLQHPGIAQIYEAGVSNEGKGTPYFAMEYVEGRPLNEYVRQSGMTPKDCCSLMIKVCEAVNHAHQRGVIHRDLKPGNILVDGRGQPKVLDFGIARATDADLQVTTIQTNIGQLLGTLPYMSPEQVAADPNQLDTRSDVYALGVILYELLAGRTPLDLRKKMIHEAARVIREEEPTRLSAIHRTLRGDLDTIVGKALEKDRARRYQSASDFAADLQRHLNHEPVFARPPSMGYQFTKFAQRHRATVTAAGLVLVALVGGVIGTTWGMLSANENARLAETNEREANRNAKLAELRALEEKAAKERADEYARQADENARLAEQRALEEKAAKEQAESEAAKYGRVIDFLQGMLISVNPYTADNPVDVTVREVVDQAAKDIKAGLAADQPEVESAVQFSLGVAYAALDLAPQAEEMLQASLATRLKVLPPDSHEITDCEAELSEMLRLQGRFEEAEAMARRVLEKRRREPDPDETRIATSLNTLALVLQNSKGDEQEIEALYQESLALRRKVHGDIDYSVLNSLNNLAQFVIDRRHDVEGGRKMLEEAIAIGYKIAPGGSLATALCIQNLSQLEREAGNLDRAMELCLELIEMERRVLPKDSPRLGDALNTTAIMFRRAGKFAEAEAMYREALDINLAHYGERGEKTMDTKENLAVLLRDLRRFEESEALTREALAYRLETVGERDWLTLNDRAGLAALLYFTLRYDESIAAYREVVRVFHEDLGPEAFDAANYEQGLAVALAAAGQFEEAQQWYETVLSKRQARQAADHPDIARTLEAMASIWCLQGRAAEAEGAAREALEIRIKKLAPGHRDIAASQVTLGWALTLQGSEKAAEAEAMLREGAEQVAKVNPEGHWAIGDARSILGACLLAVGKKEEAEGALRGGLLIMEGDQWCPTLRKKAARERLAAWCDAMGRGDEAAQLRSEH